MGFSFHFRKCPPQKENVPDGSDMIMDGDYRKLDSGDIEILDLDEEQKKENDAVKDAYQKIGLSDIHATEAEIKQAYYDKRQEIRSYSLKDENRILLELKSSFELIMAHHGTHKHDEQPDFYPAGINTGGVIENFSEATGNAPEDLLSWDDLLDEIDGEHKKKQKRNAARKGILLASCCILLLLVFAGIFEMRKIKSLICELPEADVIEFVARQKIKLKHEQNIVIEKKDITQYNPEGGLYIPLLHIYLQNCSYVVEKGSVAIDVKSILLCHYTISEGNQLSYRPISAFQYSTGIQLDLEGTWVGIFSTNMESKNSNSAVIKIRKDEQGYLTGLCEIEADNGKKGIYTANIEQVADTVDVNITGKEWIDKPTFFIMSDFIAYYDVQNEELLPSGKNDIYFTFIKENEE